jgi:hypothetical protein
MKNYKFQTRILVISLTLGICFTMCSFCLADEGPSYLVYLINKFQADVRLLSVNIDLSKHFATVEYRANTTEKKLVEIGVAEVLNDFQDLKILGSFNVQASQSGLKNLDVKVKYSNSGFKKNMALVMWVDTAHIVKNGFTESSKKSMLDQIDIIRGEQDRLTEIVSEKGNKDLLYEVTRNFQE